MTALVWDEIGSRVYEAGLDRGVLYLPGGNSVVWNGLVSVAESSDNGAHTMHYIDGQKYADLVSGEDYKATISAFTYPDEFEQFIGIDSVGGGFLATRQPRSRFSFSYRTGVMSDVNLELGYKIHLVYNAIALPSSVTYNTLSNSPDTAPFSWDIVATPVAVPGRKPTAHLVIDTRDLQPEGVQGIEDILYGTSETDAQLPDPTNFLDMISEFFLIVVDNLDGTWTATGPASYFVINTADEFEISDDNLNATYPDGNTYTLDSSD